MKTHHLPRQALDTHEKADYWRCFRSHTIDIGVSYQAQAFNFIRALDPYHVVTGAVNCGSSYQFGEVPSMPVPPTADLSLPVIAFGTQPATQLSLDYPMHENYGGNLAVKAGDGTWTNGQGGDGRFRNGAETPFVAPFSYENRSFAETGSGLSNTRRS